MCADILHHNGRALPLGGLPFLVITLLPLLVHCNSPESDPWPIDYGDAALLPGGLSNFDFVVIGGSWAGSVVAKRLSENPEWKVLVLEQGDKVTFSAEPSTDSCLAKLNHTCQWPRDNRANKPMRYVRGDPVDYNNWKEQGNYGWKWSNILHYFDKSVDHDGKTSMILNDAKPLNGSFRNVERFITNSRQQLQRYMEFAHSINYSIPTISMRVSEEISRRSNLHVIKNVEVKRINFDSPGNRAKSVTFVLRNNHELEVEVKKEVVLSAGAIDSAKILMLSGIGKPKHLESLNIPVIHDLPVGQNLQDHLALPLFLLMPVLDVQQEKGNQNDSIIQNGELPLTDFFDTIRHLESPDIEYNYFYIKQNHLATLEEWSGAFGLSDFYEKSLQYKLGMHNLLIVSAILTHPKSIGTVELRSADYTDAPKIVTNYLQSFEDVKTMLRGVRLMQLKVNLYPYAEGISLWEVPIPECYQHSENTDDYWRCYMKHFTTSKFDNVGTVKMGPAKGSSCVDPRLLLHGVKNLRVADASIMPSIPMAETTATTIMIAEKAANHIKNDWPSQKLLFQSYFCHNSANRLKVCNT